MRRPVSVAVVSKQMAVEQSDWTEAFALTMTLEYAYAPGGEDQRDGNPDPAQVGLAHQL